MKHRSLLAAALTLACAALSACGLVTSTNRSVFVLFDASGTYVKSVPVAARLANLMVAELQPGDWVGVGQISSCSFSEKEIILQQQLPETPSLADQTKRVMFEKLGEYASAVKSTKYTDIHGALAQAAFELRQRPEAARYIVVFSDMIEDHAPKCDTSKIALDLNGITVIAANVIKSNPANPDAYFQTLKNWETTVTEAGGVWALSTSPDQLPKLITAR